MDDLVQKVLSRIHLFCWQNKVNVNKLLLLPNLLWTEKKQRELDIYSSSLLAKQALERRTEHNLQIEGEIHVEKVPFLFVDNERLEEFLIEEREEENRQLLSTQKCNATHNKLKKDTSTSAQTNEKVKISEKSRFKSRDQKPHGRKIRKCFCNGSRELGQICRKCENAKFEDYTRSGKKKVSQKNEGNLVSSCDRCIRIYGDKKLTIEMCDKIKKQCALNHQSQ